MLSQASMGSLKDFNYTKLKTPAQHKMPYITIYQDTFQSIQKQNNKSVITKLSFKGLTKAMGAQLYDTGHQVAALMEKFPKANGIVGNLPNDWLESLPGSKKEKAETIKDIYKAFAKASKDLEFDLEHLNSFFNHYDINWINIETRFKRSIAATTLRNTLRKHNIINKNDKITVEFIGMGCLGCAYKFNVKNKDYVFKVFHRYDDIDLKGSYMHGKYIEVNRAQYIKKQAREGDCCKFYFADLKNDYMVNEFISDTNIKPYKNIDPIALGIKFIDKKDGINILNEYLIDYGGMGIYDSIFAKNKTARSVIKTICKNNPINKWFKGWDDLYNKAIENKIANKNDIILGLIAFLHFLPTKQQENRIKVLIQNKELTYKQKDAIYRRLMIDSGEPNIILDKEKKSAYVRELLDTLDYHNKVKIQRDYIPPAKDRYITTFWDSVVKPLFSRK